MMNKIMSLTKQLIAIESTDKKKDKLQEAIDVCAKELDGYTIETFNQNAHPSILVYSAKQRPKQFDVIFNGHLDVVSALPHQFVPEERGGKLYGRGACDMKAAAVVELLVFKEVAKMLSRPVALQLVTDEEIGGYDGTYAQIKSGVRSPFVIAGESTDLCVGQKSKGVIWMNVKAKGTAAHGAYQWRGESAILKMKRAIDLIEKEFPILTKDVWRTTINIAKIETTNTTYNKVPDDCLMKLDIRYTPEDWKTIKNKLEKMFHGLEMEFLEFEPPQVTNETNPYYQQLLKSIESVASKKADVIAKHGSSDVRHFSRVEGEGVVFGPVGSGLHSDGEWVDIKSLETYHAILAMFLRSLG
ncbi:MAG: M20/M25/M40 family metallo-hydrolase [bacterium]